MTDFRGGDAAVDEYRRALLSAARDRAVADAEQEVCAAWEAELAHVGHMTRLGMATARAACDAARTLVRSRQATGDPQAISEAQERLEMAEEQARQSVGAADALLEIIGEEQDLMSRAAEERSLVAQAHRVRVWSAWQAVHGFEDEWPATNEGDGTAAGTGISPRPAPQGPTEAGQEPGGRKRFRGANGTPGSESDPGTWPIGGTGN